MSNKKKYIKYLSQSILLEEGGLPRMNLTIILLIFVTVAAFITWSTVVEINEVIEVEGVTERSGSSLDSFVIKTLVPSSEIGTIDIGADVLFRIKGLTDRKPAKGQVDRIDKEPIQNQQGKTVYETVIGLADDIENRETFNKKFISGMSVKVEIISGKKNLLQYLLGPVFSKGTN